MTVAAVFGHVWLLEADDVWDLGIWGFVKRGDDVNQEKMRAVVIYVNKVMRASLSKGGALHLECGMSAG